METLRLAIVGAGWAGTRQAEAALETEGRVRVTTVIDRDVEQAQQLAARLGIARWGTTLEVAMESEDVDAVSVCTPHDLHAPMAIAAAQAGRHVLVEKPMALTVAEASAMIAAADTAGVTLFVAENQVYTPEIRGLREMVRSGDPIGGLAFASCIAGYRAPSPAYDGRRAWLTRPEAGGTGTWMLQGVHTVARLRAVLGEVESVFILEHRTPSFLRPDLEATMSGTVVLEGGLVVWLVQTPETHLAPPLGGFGLYGDDAVVLADAKGYRVHRQGAAIRQRRWPRPPRSSYAEELLAFAAQVAGRAVGPTDGRSERRTLGVMEAALESARTRLPVHLPTRFPGIGVGPGSA